jgi:outer membrane protein assembly factor BamA
MLSASPARRSALILFLCASVLALAPTSFAQSSSSGAFHLTKISVTGAQRFTESAIVAASGLSQGQTVTMQDVSAAADRLAKSGAFEKVAFRYFTQGNDLDAIFLVTESKQLLPCRFDNFVWFTPAELDSALRQKIPLYDGATPPSGTMLQAIQTALEGMLREKGIAGSVRSIPYASAPGQPLGAMRFSVEGVSLPIAKLSFPGASAISEQELEQQAAKLLGQDYSMTDVAIFARASLIPLYGERGYLRAQFADPVGQLVAASGADPAKDVSVTIPVREGLSYEWSGAVWSGNHVFTATDLNHMLGMKPDEVASTKKYDQGLADVNDAYSRQGYIQMVISSQPEFDDSTRRVTYRISVQEGPQFRMGSLEIIGLPPDATKRLLKSWKMQSGEVFDQTYMKAFLKTELPKNLHFNPPHPTTVSTKVQPDPNAKTVDVQIGVH